MSYSSDEGGSLSVSNQAFAREFVMPSTPCERQTDRGKVEAAAVKQKKQPLFRIRQSFVQMPFSGFGD